MCIVSIPAISFFALQKTETHHRVGNSLRGPVVLLHDVVEILRLAQSDVQAGGGIDAANAGEGVA